MYVRSEEGVACLGGQKKLHPLFGKHHLKNSTKDLDTKTKVRNQHTILKKIIVEKMTVRIKFRLLEIGNRRNKWRASLKYTVEIEYIFEPNCTY